MCYYRLTCHASISGDRMQLYYMNVTCICYHTVDTVGTLIFYYMYTCHASVQRTSRAMFLDVNVTLMSYHTVDPVANLKCYCMYI